MRTARTALAVAASVVVLGAATADAATRSAPHVGSWTGTATDAGTGPGYGAHALRFRVVRRDGRYELRDFSATFRQTCSQPQGPGEPDRAVELDQSIRFKRIRVRADGRFRASDGESNVSGRFVGRRRLTGTADGTGVGITCSFPGGSLRAAPAS